MRHLVPKMMQILDLFATNVVAESGKNTALKKTGKNIPHTDTHTQTKSAVTSGDSGGPLHFLCFNKAGTEPGTFDAHTRTRQARLHIAHRISTACAFFSLGIPTQGDVPGSGIQHCLSAASGLGLTAVGCRTRKTVHRKPEIPRIKVA